MTNQAHIADNTVAAGSLPHGADVEPLRYRAVSRMAVTSLVLGALSLLTLFGWLFALIPISGLILGWAARRVILDNREELTGLGLAYGGMAMSLLFGGMGLGWLIYNYFEPVPFGYRLVEYAEFQPDRNVPGQVVPPAIYDLQDKKVFVRGYMAPSRRMLNLKEFILCPALPDCSFCIPDPQKTEMILVKLTGDLRTDFTTNMVRVGGRLKIDPDSPNGIPYTIEADYLR
jgi:hypothetical protein